jgi:fatty acid CoA ligase FadD9
MSTTTQDARIARRVEDLTANDPQFAAARPDQAITDAVEQPGMPLPQITQTVLDGYADRPALGQRVVDYVTDPATGRTRMELVSR